MSQERQKFPLGSISLVFPGSHQHDLHRAGLGQGDSNAAPFPSAAGVSLIYEKRVPHPTRFSLGGRNSNLRLRNGLSENDQPWRTIFELCCSCPTAPSAFSAAYNLKVGFRLGQ